MIKFMYKIGGSIVQKDIFLMHPNQCIFEKVNIERVNLNLQIISQQKILLYNFIGNNMSICVHETDIYQTNFEYII